VTNRLSYGTALSFRIISLAEKVAGAWKNSIMRDLTIYTLDQIMKDWMGVTYSTI
jgi:hypothetical protein